MRIDGTGRPNSVARSRNGSDANRSENVFSLTDAEGSQGTREAAAPAAIGGIDALLALQAVEVPGERGARVRHGHEMLDLLDDLKIALLCGGLPGAKLESLVHTVSKRPVRFGDERIEAVLDEIELRARVELAKLGREAA